MTEAPSVSPQQRVTELLWWRRAVRAALEQGERDDRADLEQREAEITEEIEGVLGTFELRAGDDS